MGTVKRDNEVLENQLGEIQRLEAQLIQMKRDLLISKSQMSEDPEDEAETAFLIVKNNDRFLAIPVDQVEEVIEMVAVLSPNKQQLGVVGMINYHGELIALFDLGELAGMGKTEIDPDNVIVVCIIGESHFAMMVQETNDVVTVERSKIKIADEVMPGLLEEVGVIQTKQFTASVIDIWSAALTVQISLEALSQEVEIAGDGE